MEACSQNQQSEKKKKKIPIYWLQLEGCLPALMLMHVTWLRYIKLITNATVA